MLGRSSLIAGVLAAAAGVAHADQPLGPPVTNRNYAIELYDNGAIGNDAVVAMGGAAVANASGSSGTLVNPSAPAVRPTTDHDHWSLDYHLDYLNSSLSTDYANTGNTAVDGSGTSVFTIGGALRYGDWAAAITTVLQSTHIDDTQTAGSMPLIGDTLHTKLAIARWVPSWDVAIGVALDAAQFQLQPSCNGVGCGTLFSVSGVGGEAGATWIPRMQSFRVGVDLATPVTGAKVNANSSCADPSSCEGYILPSDVVSAWRTAGGFAYRFAPTAWNQQVPQTFREERALTLAADLVIIGSTRGAYGLEAFGKHELQRSGATPAYSMRGGAEYEWLPGRLRVRGGSYWEPGRFDGVSGRLHGTFGLEVALFDFLAWGPRRAQLTLTGDVAERYRNAGVSVGFWH
jgi:hypothetical protein